MLYDLYRPLSAAWDFTRGLLISQDKRISGGVRLIQCDLEVQLAILTDNEELRTKFREERIRLFQYGTLVTSNAFKQLSRLVPFWGPLLMRIFRNFFLNDLHLE
ncbi:unnamed protein product [Rotaria magnacalcarata]